MNNRPRVSLSSSADPPRRLVFVTGGSGYLGVPLLERLRDRGHSVTALSRAASAQRIPAGIEVFEGDALRGESYSHRVPPADTFVHLVGTAKPSPSKARQFIDVDLASLRTAVDVAKHNGILHFIFVSVAQPAPVMRAYVAARAAAEAYLSASGLDVTILRPWYVLGPGHRWPYLLLPWYALMRRVPAARASALRLGLVTHKQMLDALVRAVEHPATGKRIVTVEEIRGPQGIATERAAVTT
jgi:uncharacterized protein YbjT (DUF2867 family)